MNSQTAPVLANLTELEQKVAAAALLGEIIVPATSVGVKDLALTDDPELQVRADLIRELLLGRRGEVDPRGLAIKGVRVVGMLDLDHIAAGVGIALIGCALPDEISCYSARIRDIDLTGSLLAGIYADRLRTDGDIQLNNTTLVSADHDATVQLNGAHIGGSLDLDGAEITNTVGPALDADHLRTDGGISLRDATLKGAGKWATVSLGGSQIGGQIRLDRTRIVNSAGPALFADDLRSSGKINMEDVYLTGVGELATMRLGNAHVVGELVLNGAQITNDTGPALFADRLHADSDVCLDSATLVGDGEDATIRFGNACIKGAAVLTLEQLTNSTGPLLIMVGTKIGHDLVLPASVACPAGWSGMSRHICPDNARIINVDGLVFHSLSMISWRQWLHLLVHHTPSYCSQPLQHLAAVERAAGHDNNSREVLIAQQDDLRRRAPEAFRGRLAQARHRLWGWLGRYGYHAHRLVIALALVLAFAASLGYIAGQVPTRPGHHVAERVSPPTVMPNTAGTPCSTAELIGLGIDRGLPLGTTGLRNRCDLDTSTRRGQAFTYGIWVLQALVWALATLAIAAYTGLVRKLT